MSSSSTAPPKRTNGTNDSGTGTQSLASRPDMRQLSPHPKYNLTGADFFVLIGTTIFGFHYFYIERDTTSFLPSPSKPLKPGEKRKNEWNSEHKALVLTDQDVSIEEFENFLWVFYNEEYDKYEAPLLTWIGILKLATRWGCTKMTRLALAEVVKREEEVSTVDLIVLCTQKGAPRNYRLRLLTRLATRETAPTEEEEKALGPKMTCKLFRIREEIRSPGGRSPVPNGLDGVEATSIVATFLGWEYIPPASTAGGSDVPTLHQPSLPNGNGGASGSHSTGGANGNSKTT
ncbi:hypothetical protein CC1G_10853 [Coprinopsis cinerea okayama7|uniref:BTB domain-containing protein n=1 Tax=Coprinopsis cinerea (strain Okayama-7 / 130 / ATCC MYA-4618 / FGSC 9003) TaxID=240176 RepID=A8NKS6_COPC7|nr:hypothetical protein CC1G_10853 [Coprinopsis cinerea okayama7\|eukprot:XP_001834535.1 hypothetical protein CC1G_10853 [Coprinopsis cinerea okayama7\